LVVWEKKREVQEFKSSKVQEEGTQDPRSKNEEGQAAFAIEEGSLDFATRRAKVRRGRKNRVTPLGMTGLVIWRTREPALRGQGKQGKANAQRYKGKKKTEEMAGRKDPRAGKMPGATK
jgi:hypothetical protein